MGLLNRLYDVYNSNEGKIGKFEVEGRRPLTPMFHSLQQSHIEVHIDDEGNFLRAKVLSDKNERNTIIPVTEQSSSRSSGITPHPVCDNLMYIAGDFSKYASGKDANVAMEKHKAYMDNFEAFVSFADNKMLNSLAIYLRKDCLIKDLADSAIIEIDNGEIVEKSKSDKEIYSLVAEICSAFVRFVVDSEGYPDGSLSNNKELWQLWTDYVLSAQSSENVCFVCGKTAPTARLHGKYIRNSGDGAKLLSSNDSTNFTYRGRFSQPDEAFTVSAEVSGKAHAALRWLIDKQAYRKFGHTILCFTSSDAEVPNILEPPNIILADVPIDNTENVGTLYAQSIRKALLGFRQSIPKPDNVVVVGFDSVTPGRLSVILYREFTVEDYLQSIENWYSTLCYEYDFADFSDKNNVKHYSRVSTPSPYDVIECCYPPSISDNLKHDITEKILLCIVNGTDLPKEFVVNAVNRTGNKVIFEKEYQWNKSLSTTCALYRKNNPKENYQMALEEQRTTRDYLYGRLLAVADILERKALRLSDENRATTATRLFSQFAVQPFRTWNIIYSSLNPYIMKLGKDANYLLGVIDGIMNKFTTDDFTNNKPLSGEYLLGYHQQRKDIFTKKTEIIEEDK